MLDDHFFHIHAEGRQNIQIRSLDSDFRSRKRVMSEGDAVERQRGIDAPLIFNSHPAKEEKNVQPESDYHCQQKNTAYIRLTKNEHDPSINCIPQHQRSRAQYHLSKSHPYPRELNTDPIPYNSSALLCSYHSTPKQLRIVDYEKQRICEGTNVLDSSSAFQRVRNRSGGEQLMSLPFGTDFENSSRLLNEGSNLHGKDNLGEQTTSNSSCCRPVVKSLKTSLMCSNHTSSVYPTTSGIKRKYIEHPHGNAYETRKRKGSLKVPYSTGYTSDESDEGGSHFQNCETRVYCPPGIGPLFPKEKLLKDQAMIDKWSFFTNENLENLRETCESVEKFSRNHLIKNINKGDEKSSAVEKFEHVSRGGQKTEA
nr:uncharacterized protein LOC128699532 [Cherax quadricarinatus]